MEGFFVAFQKSVPSSIQEYQNYLAFCHIRLAFGSQIFLFYGRNYPKTKMTFVVLDWIVFLYLAKPTTTTNQPTRTEPLPRNMNMILVKDMNTTTIQSVYKDKS
jgi:hypothetical protein